MPWWRIAGLEDAVHPIYTSSDRTLVPFLCLHTPYTQLSIINSRFLLCEPALCCHGD